MVAGQIAHLLKGIAVVPEFQPEHLQAFQLDRGDLGVVLGAHALADLAFIGIKAYLQMSETAVKEGGEGPEHFFEVVFQLTVIQQANGGLKKRRYGELNLVRPGQGAMINFAGPWLCITKGGSVLNAQTGSVLNAH